jgi:hypothetical protein
VAVRWRQYSEPNDPVWWVDLLSPEQFAEGYGSQTPMYTGQCEVVRYYPYFDMAWSIFCRVVPEQVRAEEVLSREPCGRWFCSTVVYTMSRIHSNCRLCASK